jgi:phosphotransferase system enzyme I (PtsI)
MHPAQILAVKQEILRSDSKACAAQVKKILAASEPARIEVLLHKLVAL